LQRHLENTAAVINTSSLEELGLAGCSFPSMGMADELSNIVFAGSGGGDG